MKYQSDIMKQNRYMLVCCHLIEGFYLVHVYIYCFKLHSSTVFQNICLRKVLDYIS